MEEIGDNYIRWITVITKRQMVLFFLHLCISNWIQIYKIMIVYMTCKWMQGVLESEGIYRSDRGEVNRIRPHEQNMLSTKLYKYICVFCVYVSVQCKCCALQGQKRAFGLKRSYRWLWAAMWLLGTEPRFSARAAIYQLSACTYLHTYLSIFVFRDKFFCVHPLLSL